MIIETSIWLLIIHTKINRYYYAIKIRRKYMINLYIHKQEKNEILFQAKKKQDYLIYSKCEGEASLYINIFINAKKIHD